MEHPENSEEYKGLVVNKGIEQPSSVNPYLKRKPKKRSSRWLSLWTALQKVMLLY